VTCIAALVHRGRVWMAGDGLASTSACCFGVGPKVATYAAGTVVAGYAGEWYGRALADVDWSLDWELSIHQQIERRNLEPGQGGILIGTRGQIWSYDQGALYQHSDRYAAIGSGTLAALGSLYSTAGLPPQDRVQIAIRAASAHCPSVGGRITTVSTRK